jgi:non-homologous end joining protein Ku
MAVNRFKTGEFDPSAYFTTGYNKYKDRVWLRKAAAPSYSTSGTTVRNIDYSKLTLPKVAWDPGYGPTRTEASEKAAKSVIQKEIETKRQAALKLWVAKNRGAPQALFDAQNPSLIVSTFNINKTYQAKTNEQIQKGIPVQAKAPTSAYGSTLTDPELTKLQGRFKQKKMSDRYNEAAKMITERAQYDKDLGREKAEYGKYLTAYQSAFDRLKDSLGQS